MKTDSIKFPEVGAWGKFVENQATAKKVEDFGEFAKENNSSINVDAVNAFQNFITVFEDKRHNLNRADDKLTHLKP